MPLVHKNDAEPKSGPTRSVANALVPLAVAPAVALQVLPATSQVTVAALQSPVAIGAAGTEGVVNVVGVVDVVGVKVAVGVI